MRPKLNISPGMLLAFVAVFLIGTASAATAASMINGKKIKRGSIPYSAFSADAKKKSKGNAGPAGAQGPAGPPSPNHWALVNQDGSVARGSAGVSSTKLFNSGYWQYRVTFPRDVSACSYAGATSDPGVIGANEYTQPTHVSISRSNTGGNVLAVNLWTVGSSPTSIEDSFSVALYC